MSEGGDKTEAPTPRRRQKAAEDGSVLRSKDFGTALVVVAGVGWLLMFGPQLIAACKAVMTASLQFDHADVADFSPFRPLAAAGGKLIAPLASLFVITLVATVAGAAGLGSFSFNGKLMAPKFSRINPGAGIKRIVGMQGWIELGKSMLKVVLLGAIGGWMLWKSTRSTLGLSSSNVFDAIGVVGGTFNGIMIAMAMGLVGIALLDVPLQIFQLLQKLRMTKQEVRDEHKESEGSPEAKAHIRQKQRAMANRQIRSAVAESHVILTNPTHFSVALRYDRTRDQVPVVVAKGRGATALAIRELAAETGTPILEYPMLARAVYYTSKEGQEVRDDLYLAIATVLAFVFGLNQQQGGSQMPPPIDVPAGARFDENGVSLSVA